MEKTKRHTHFIGTVGFISTFIICVSAIVIIFEIDVEVYNAK